MLDSINCHIWGKIGIWVNIHSNNNGNEKSINEFRASAMKRFQNQVIQKINIYSTFEKSPVKLKATNQFSYVNQFKVRSDFFSFFFFLKKKANRKMRAWNWKYRIHKNEPKNRKIKKRRKKKRWKEAQLFHTLQANKIKMYDMHDLGSYTLKYHSIQASYICFWSIMYAYVSPFSFSSRVFLIFFCCCSLLVYLEWKRVLDRCVYSYVWSN